jgi:ribosome-associated protein
MSSPLLVREGLVVPSEDLEWTAVRSSGPGGQNVNKVSSKVRLRFRLATTSSLDEPTKERLRALFGSRLDAEGSLCVVSEATRDQARNLEDARDKLRAMIVAALTVPKKRKKSRPSRGAREARLRDKKKHAAKKQSRRVSFD